MDGTVTIYVKNVYLNNFIHVFSDLTILLIALFFLYFNFIYYLVMHRHISLAINKELLQCSISI